MIPLCDLSAQYESLKDEIDAAMQAAGNTAPPGGDCPDFRAGFAERL